MMDYMRDGGWGMWGILIVAIGCVAMTFLRSKEKRVGVLLGGCVAVLTMGMLGMATGMAAVSRNVQKFPDKVEAIAVGLGELANNGTFAGTLVLVLGAAALVLGALSKGQAKNVTA